MIESMTSNCWQMSSISSPSGSVDSGMGYSPQHYSYATEEYCNQIFGGNPESPNSCTSGSLSGIVTNSRIGVSQPDSFSSYSPVLTQRELEELSEISDEYLSPSPCSVENVSAVTDFEEIGNIGFPQEDVESILNLDLYPEEKSLAPIRPSTVRRKERQKIRQRDLHQTHPGVDLCLVPKSGTSKPRQSRKKRNTGAVDSMAGAQQANQKKFYTGARVKITAKERLQKLRNEQANASAAQNATNSSPQAISRSANVTKHSANDGSFRLVQAPIYGNAKVPTPSRQQQYIQHSVERILQPARPQNPEYQAVACDVLDQGIEDIVYRNDSNLIHQYIEQAKSSCNMAAQTLSHEIINKLNQKMGVMSAQHIEEVTMHVCKLYQSGVNQKNFRGETPIYRAALFANVGAVKALLKYDANPYIEESSAGETALHAAVKSKNLEVVGLIIKNGSHYSGINKKTFNGNTALHGATGLRNVDIDTQSKMVVALLGAGADPSIKNNMNEMAHSFLPEPLKELQIEMRRLNGRRRSVSVPIQSNIPSPPQVESLPYIRTQIPPPQYPAVTPTLLQQMMRPMPLAQPQFQHRVQHVGGFTPVMPNAASQMSGYGAPPPYQAPYGITPQDMDEVLSLWE